MMCSVGEKTCRNSKYSRHDKGNSLFATFSYFIELYQAINEFYKTLIIHFIKQQQEEEKKSANTLSSSHSSFLRIPDVSSLSVWYIYYLNIFE